VTTLHPTEESAPVDRTQKVARVAVVIPVRDRMALLLRTLDALEAQTYRDFEVVVVDDSSTDGAPAAAAARLIAGRPVRVLTNPGRGAVDARRHGCDCTTSPLLAFTDSDCRPVPEWLDRLVAAVDRGADLVAGPTVPERPPLPLERTMASSDDGGYPTCNVMYRRGPFERVGGFAADAYLELGYRAGSRAKGLGFGEDSLVAWKVRRQGAAAAYEPGAIVRHAVFPPDVSDLFSRNWQMGAYPAMIRAIPEVRGSLLTNGLFLGERCRLLMYPLLASLLLRRWRFAMAALAGWSILRLRRSARTGAPWSARIAALPMELAKDATLTAALVSGSVRARSVVL
jgi:glycosyltransferase involved in cell wall biosynthesis